MPAPQPFEFTSAPLLVNGLQEALKHATIIVNPETGQSYRINVVDVATVLCVDENTGAHVALDPSHMQGWTIYTLQKVDYTSSDHSLTAAQLDEKYNPRGYGEHPKYLRRDWYQEVSDDNTLRGYWDWVKAKLNEEQG